jgi:hypothetical protein
MKLGGLFITLIALIIAFYRWYQESEARALKAPAPSARS